MSDAEEQTRSLICFCVFQYGYRLPELAEDEVLYCSVYFRLLGEILFRYPQSRIKPHLNQCCYSVCQMAGRDEQYDILRVTCRSKAEPRVLLPTRTEQQHEPSLLCSEKENLKSDKVFTSVLSSYPLSCIRLQPVQRCPRVDLQGALGGFLSDVRHTLKTVCGFPAHLSRQPCYRAVRLSSAGSLQVHTHTHTLCIDVCYEDNLTVLQTLRGSVVWRSAVSCSACRCSTFWPCCIQTDVSNNICKLHLVTCFSVEISQLSACRHWL